MEAIENERIAMRVYKGCNIMAFRKSFASQELTEIITRKEWWYISWRYIIKIEKTNIYKMIKEERQRKVMEYRIKIMKEDRDKIKMRYGEGYKEHFFTPYRVRCHLCQVGDHRTVDCRYTFERVFWRMMKDEKMIENEINDRNTKKYEYIKHTDNKRSKNSVTDPNEMIKEFEDVFYKENEYIKFCEVEKCKIKTQKDAKVVKRGVIVPQALKKDLDDYLKKVGEKRNNK
ncbi:hypothetical protein BDAP_001764 [Binucleata daphniae]